MKTKLNPYLKWGGMILVLFVCLYGAYSISIHTAPDEVMRYPVPLFIFDKGYLPLGNEKEIMSEIWGFSYAFTPYLPSIISVVFMKIMALFTDAPNMLLFAARWTSVLSVSLTWVFCCKIGERIFTKQYTIVLLSVLVCFLPQFVYLGCYLNNDAFSVMTSSIIIYYWLIGDKECWSLKSCVGLGLGIGLLSLAYYNAYGFILCSIIFYIYSSVKQKVGAKNFWLKALLIFLVAFSIGGWFFIRNYIIHDGDFLGMKSMYALGEIHAQDIYKPSQRINPKNLELSFYQTFLFPYYSQEIWFDNTAQSFIGVFGYFTTRLPHLFYMIYYGIFGLGFICGLAKWIQNIKKKNKIFSIGLLSCFILCMVIPLLLSMQYSYNTDYQAQGRYIMSILIPMMILVAFGYGEWNTKNMRILRYIAYAVISIYLLLFFISYFGYMIPSFNG